MKTEIYNLIILDESGSMDVITDQTIGGCNETINTIIGAQQQFAETQDNYVSIFAFQSGSRPSRYLIKNVPALEVKHITHDDYEPWGSTPLYDAVGSTLVDLRSIVKDKPLAVGNVTIITDGEENSSTQYSGRQVAQMIDALKEEGWSFNFIGANIDVKRAAASMHIDNSMAFKQDKEGTDAMFAKERASRMAWSAETHAVMAEAFNVDADGSSIGGFGIMPEEERKANFVRRMKANAKGYFGRGDKPEDKKD